jgi:hypothetical protein
MKFRKEGAEKEYSLRSDKTAIGFVDRSSFVSAAIDFDCLDNEAICKLITHPLGALLEARRR